MPNARNAESGNWGKKKGLMIKDHLTRYGGRDNKQGQAEGPRKDHGGLKHPTKLTRRLAIRRAGVYRQPARESTTEYEGRESRTGCFGSR